FGYATPSWRPIGSRTSGGTSCWQGLPRSTRLGTLPEPRKRWQFFKDTAAPSDEHAIADLICDLGHLAEERGFDFLDEVKRGIGHWYAERHASDRDRLGPDAAVEITITPR